MLSLVKLLYSLSNSVPILRSILIDLVSFLKELNAIRRKRLKMRLLIVGLIVCCTGCIMAKLENAQRLIDRSDFPDAVSASPEWVREALLTINRLEAELERE